MRKRNQRQKKMTMTGENQADKGKNNAREEEIISGWCVIT